MILRITRFPAILAASLFIFLPFFPAKMSSNSSGFLKTIRRRHHSTSPLAFLIRKMGNEGKGKPSADSGAVDDELRIASRMIKDDGALRRKIREQFKDVQLSIDHCLLKAVHTGIEMKETYEVNSRGIKIFFKSWLPENVPIKGLVFFCHGYGDTCTFFFEGTARKLASVGFGVFAMDCPGFGLSDGLHGYVPSFDRMVDDVIEQYSKVKENPRFENLPCFLMGQSMGGAVALKIHLKQPNAWDGAILIAPMCKLADDMLPPLPVLQLLIGMAKILPKQKLVPMKDLADAALREKKKRDMAIYNIISYKDKPRLRTALVMLRTTQEIENQLDKVSLPLLILHGEADIVTDPASSKALYEKASCEDKKLILYEGAYHAVLEGEPDETIFRVLNDIISWLDQHCSVKVSH